MKQYYEGLASRMISEINTISEAVRHAGEKGRNNEQVLQRFLCNHLPQRFTVSTGKVVSSDGRMSRQIDLIIHDRLWTPALVNAEAWNLVPVESVRAVICVKTTLDKPELKDSMEVIQSVRELPRQPALVEPSAKLLRPRGLIFSFRSSWSSSEALDEAFKTLLEGFDDSFRPNAACALDQAFVVRRPFTCATLLFAQHPLLHFFLFLVKTLDRFPEYRVDLDRYFTDDYGQDAAGPK
jgi:hypothetical protein